MFDTMYAWVQEGALAVEDGHVAGDYDGDQALVAQIASRYNSSMERWAAW